MLPPTHILTSLALRSALRRKQKTILWACIFGAVLPDIPFGIQIVQNLVVGLPADGYKDPPLLLWGAILHSLPLWSALSLGLFVFYFLVGQKTLGLAFWSLAAFALSGLFAHIIPDMLSHRTMVAIGPDYLWPWSYHLAPVFGLWEYRQKGQFLPKPAELLIDLALVVVIWFGPISRALRKAVLEIALTQATGFDTARKGDKA